MPVSNRPLHAIFTIFILLSLTLSACQPGQGGTSAPPPAPAATQTPSPAYTPTPLPPRTLNVCLGAAPNTLYPLGGPNAAARSVLEAVYDGPFDALGYDYKPVILEKMPNLEDGSVQLASVSVTNGNEVADADGTLTILKAGTRVRPAGCQSDECAVVFDGINPLAMDAMTVMFKLKSGLLWSDGTPVTAEDSAYAFTLAKNEETPGSKFIFDRTQSYEAVDDQTLQWWGKPGFIDPTYFVNFWTPLPKHVWGQLSASELQKSELSSRAPMGYGPYVVKEWNDDSLRLTKNPYYFRAAEGLPKFDELIFRIVPNAEAAMANLINGRCDLIDSTVNLDAQTSLLKEMDRTGQARAYFGQTPTLEWLALGISPASYDDGVQAKDRPDFFADPRLRQAIAYCLDRQAIVSNVLYGLVDVPDSFAASASPLHAASLQAYPFDPEKGKQLLNNMGWRDHDNNPATPRHAQGVDRVVNGTELNLTYIATSAAQRRQVADILSQSLIGCGIGVNVVHLSQLEFYAEGPAGPLFGRNFDLAEFAMHTPSVLPACERFASFEIPSAANHWVGTNVSGYKNPEYDAACSSARQSLPSEASHAENYRLAQAIFVQDLPAIPLFFRIETAAARFDFCNFALDPTAASDLYNIEAFDYGDACLP